MIGTSITLNNGIEMPAVGLGVYQSGPTETQAAVEAALADGYRMIDTAAAYFNEEHVGAGLRASGVPRHEMFIQTKLWMSDYGADKARHGFDRSLKKLGLDYVDLYLLHWPTPKTFDLAADSWRVLEDLLSEGRVRAIGMCNASEQDLKDLVTQTDIVPAVNQVELHPYFSQPELQLADRAMNIITQAWSPIGGVQRYATQSGDPLKDSVLLALASKYGKSAAQIILRWHIQLGHSVIPKSVHAQRIHENGDIFDFELSHDDMASINALNRNQRGGPDPAEVTQDLFGLVVAD
jgi:diketogulonate reductase-like aldo/keto reductase